jgi:hypothetical protein
MMRLNPCPSAFAEPMTLVTERPRAKRCGGVLLIGMGICNATKIPGQQLKAELCSNCMPPHPIGSVADAQRHVEDDPHRPFACIRQYCGTAR